MEWLTPKKIVLWSILLTACIEGGTVFLRFGCGLESTRDTAAVAALTGGVRIHHGYAGALLALLAVAAIRAAKGPVLARATLVFGLGLLCSDLIHHFVVLWPIVGSHEFHLLYPVIGGP